jgi:uncharacterized protein YlxW (UPF0749 family)
MLLQLTKEMDPLQKQEASLNEDIVNYNKQLESYKEIYIKSDKTLELFDGQNYWYLYCQRQFAV